MIHEARSTVSGYPRTHEWPEASGEGQIPILSSVLVRIPTSKSLDGGGRVSLGNGRRW